LWILKQDYYDSGAIEDSYANRIESGIAKEAIAGSPTWRRLSYVSYGLISGARNWEHFPTAHECAKKLMETAIIQVNKEPGEDGSKSPNPVILSGFKRYKELVCMHW